MRGPCDGQGVPLPDAERTSAVGRALRRMRLDELPQLFNVVRGDMSFIGPRPLLARDQPDWVSERIAIRPGITGWAQVHGGQQLSVEEKLALDTWYVRNAGPWIDLRIVCRTLRMMVLGKELDRLEVEQAHAGASERQRLLVVNRFFDPDASATSQLLTDLVDALDNRGFAVTVFAGRHTYLNTGAVLPARAWRAGVEVRRLRHTGFGRFSLPGRILDSATFAASAFLALLTHARPGDVILAKTDPPLISVVAWFGARLTGARLVNWCQDLFPENAAAMGVRLMRGVLGGALQALRNASLCGAEMNVAVCSSMAARLAAQGVPRERLTVISNWADGEVIRPLAPQDNPLRAAWGLGERFVVGYSGNLGCAHLVDPVIELITLLADEPKLTFLFIGAGSGYGILRAAIAERRLENVVFRPYQDRAKLRLSLTAPDLHLVTLRPEWEGLVMPSKLYGALAAGRPILFIGDPEGDAARIVRAGPGLVANPRGNAGAGRADPGAAPRSGAPRADGRRRPRRLRRLLPETPASTPGPAACTPPPSQGWRANCPCRWRRNEQRRRAPAHHGRRPRPLRGAGDPGQPQRRLADRLAHRERVRLPELPGPALALEGGCAALFRCSDRQRPGDQAARHHQVSVVPGAGRPRLAGRRRVGRQSHDRGDRLPRLHQPGRVPVHRQSRLERPAVPLLL